MRSQVVALIFVALIASSQCQITPQTQECINIALSLGETITTFIEKQNWSNLGAIKDIITKVHNFLIPCSEAIKILKVIPDPYNITMKCIGQVNTTIKKINVLKGNLNGSMNYQAVLAELKGLSPVATALISACKSSYK